MKSLMQTSAMGVNLIRERAETLFADRAVTSRAGALTYGDVIGQAQQLANALSGLGIEAGDAVATFAWNTPEHLACYIGVPCSGRVLHTVNIRMHPDQIAYTLRHAGDQAVVVDGELVDVFADVPLPDNVAHVIVAGTEEQTGRLAERFGSTPVHRLAALSGAELGAPWTTPDEDAAAGVCYTSGTTGTPKGVVYSHRSTYLHALTLTTVDAFAIGHHDVTLPVVPMFHANAWGLPYASMLAGAGQALPGPDTSLAGLQRLIADAGVTMSAGVPTVWQEAATLLHAGELTGSNLAPLQRIVIGGSAVPRSMAAAFEEAGIRVIHAWGMTECSPVGLVAFDPVGVDDDERARARLSQGRPLPGLRVRTVPVVAEEDRSDTAGELQISGPWVASSYLASEDAADDRFVKDDGRRWLRTGDVAELDQHGYVRLIDRTKDLIKSGGEWISSVELEDLLTSHPAVTEAAVIPTPDPRWGERPFAYVVASDGVDEEDLQDHLRGSVPRWQLPDGYALVSALPRTSVGKIDKKRLRSDHPGGHDADG